MQDVLLEQVERLRLEAGAASTDAHKAAFGQFLTPLAVTQQMAAMLVCPGPQVSILDAGAGVGSLFAACVAQLCRRPKCPERIEVTAYEVDPTLLPYLHRTIALCRAECAAAKVAFSAQIVTCDFLQNAAQLLGDNLLAVEPTPRYTCAILNPPYKKIHSSSRQRAWLRQMEIETSNLYTGFLAAAMRLLAPYGEMVAITPRSFCNGPYFKPFRRDLLHTMTLRHLHVYESRERAFRDDKVLQENLIFHATKGSAVPEQVVISTSSGPTDEQVTARCVPYKEVVSPDDPQSFIRLVPNQSGDQVARRMSQLPCSLQSLGLSVSTGRVVDFRAREWLRSEPEPGTAPLLYPTHLNAGTVTWPVGRTRKPCALVVAEQTRSQLVPNGNYVLVKRFSTKEEAKRIVATVYEAGSTPGPFVGFENHLNYFHSRGQGIDLTLARGLATFLNSSTVDTYFRQFNGHTQVNATDLRSLKYLMLQQFQRLGAMVGAQLLPQAELDAITEEVFDAPTS